MNSSERQEVSERMRKYWAGRAVKDRAGAHERPRIATRPTAFTYPYLLKYQSQ